jgi:hypothetical protein
MLLLIVSLPLLVACVARPIKAEVQFKLPTDPWMDKEISTNAQQELTNFLSSLPQDGQQEPTSTEKIF